VARTRAQRRHQTLWLSILLVITLLVVLFGRDVSNAAHGSVSPRRSENRTFGQLASVLISQENYFDSRLRYLLTNGQSLSRPVFAARLTQLADQLPLWSTQGDQLRRPMLAHDVNDALAQETSQRVNDYESILSFVAESLVLPSGTLPWVETSATLSTTTAQTSLLSTSHQWRLKRWSLAREPGRVKLKGVANGVALLHLATTIEALRAAPTLAASRGVGIAAVSVQPSPLPAPTGELLLPPVPRVHLGVSVLNANYIDQSVSVTVTLIPLNHRGLRQSQTLTTVLGPDRAYAFVPKLLTTRASERARLIITVAGAPTAQNMTRKRIYSVVMSPSGNTTRGTK
jgi:hypothetical protein